MAQTTNKIEGTKGVKRILWIIVTKTKFCLSFFCCQSIKNNFLSLQEIDATEHNDIKEIKSVSRTTNIMFSFICVPWTS